MCSWHEFARKFDIPSKCHYSGSMMKNSIAEFEPVSSPVSSQQMGLLEGADKAASKSARPPSARKRTNGGTTINDICDLPPDGWKDPSILADSLWIIGDRDKSGAHDGHYHGNFIPQIPNQLMRRFTREGDIVLDTFLGSGTTMIEAKRLGRSCIGIELLPEVAQATRKLVNQEPSNNPDAFTKVITGDCTVSNTRKKIDAELTKQGKSEIGLIIMHPPYHDIVSFSDNPADLSNALSVEDFITRFGDAVENMAALLSNKRYLAIVIGDKYSNSEWVPLSTYLINETLQRDAGQTGKRSFRLALKSVIVKNMVNNRAKRNKENLWRYRAIKGGFYVFRHEYILLFQKKPK